MNYMDEMGMGTEGAGRITMPLCDRVINAEATGEYTMPDYQPEIRRILGVRPTVLPPAKYVSASGVELNGSVDLQVIYVGADGGIYSVPLMVEYSCSAPIERAGEFDLNEGVATFACVVPETVNTRVLAPRKLSVRCRLRAHIRAYGQMEVEERQIGAVDPSSIRRRRLECRGLRPVCGMSDLITVSEEITGVGEDARVSVADAVPFVREVRMAEDRALALGEVFLKLLVAREDGRVELHQRKIPFEGEIELEGANADTPCRAVAFVSELNVHVEEGRILSDVGLLLEGRGMGEVPLGFTTDLYSVERESECEWTEYELPTSLGCGNGNLTQSERIPLSTINLPEDTEILDVWGSVTFDGCSTVGETVFLSGQSRYQLLCQANGELFSSEVTVPVRYELGVIGEDVVGFDGVGQVISCRARNDGEQLLLDAEIAVATDLSGTCRVSAVRCIRFGETLEERENRMVVYYPSSAEDLWAVAKKYHVSSERILEGAGYYYF